MELMYDLISLLVSPNNSAKKVADTQAHMRNQKLLDIVCRVSLSDGVPKKIFAPSLLTTADSIRSNHESQAIFSTLANGRAIVTLLEMTLVRDKAFSDRCAALYCFECCMLKNLDQQLKVALTFLPSQGPAQTPGIPAGGQICMGVLSKNPLNTWFAALAWTNILSNNKEAKEKLLQAAVQEAGQQPRRLLEVCVSRLIQPPGVNAADSDRILVSFLMVLGTWLCDCSLAVKIFLDCPESLPFLISQLNDSAGTSVLVQQLSAVVLGACIAYSDPQLQSKFSREQLIDLIKTRGEGVEAYLGSLDRFINSATFATAVESARFQDVSSPDVCWFGRELANQFRTIVVMVRQNMTAPPPRDTSVEAHDQIMQSYKQLIGEMDKEISDLKAQVAQGVGGSGAPANAGEADALRAQVGALQTQLAGAGEAQQQLANSQAQLQQATAQLQQAQAEVPPDIQELLNQYQTQIGELSAGAEQAAIKETAQTAANQALQAQVAEANASAATARARLSSVAPVADTITDGEQSEAQQMLMAAHADIAELHSQVAQLTTSKNAAEVSAAAQQQAGAAAANKVAELQTALDAATASAAQANAAHAASAQAELQQAQGGLAASEQQRATLEAQVQTNNCQIDDLRKDVSCIPCRGWVPLNVLLFAAISFPAP